MSCVMGIDIGTTSTIGILIRPPGEVLALVSRPATLRTPHPGWAEADPAEWWANVCAIVPALLKQAAIPPQEVRGLGVTGMVPAMVLLAADFRVLRPSIQPGRMGWLAVAQRAGFGIRA